MNGSIVALSRGFFQEIVLPILEREFPDETRVSAFGLFGYGSEAYGLDDAFSRDHHWGLRIDALTPDSVPAERRTEMVACAGAQVPSHYQGMPLREGHLPGAGLTMDSLPAFLRRTIGLERAPLTHVEWLQIPEEDILHVVNGEVWHDPSGEFTAVRGAFAGHYPEPVRRRRIAHWCRYFSGMGSYALKRALLRSDWFYAATAFGKAIRWGVQLAFLLERQYFPYDKWLMAHLRRLPRLGERMVPLVEEAVLPSTSWERKLDLLDRLADILDETMVADGVIRPHPRYLGSPTSGYRLLEHAYAELIQEAPEELRQVVPLWDQVHLESFHSGYVAGLDLEKWDAILGLRPLRE
jgi:hypothetical protein